MPTRRRFLQILGTSTAALSGCTHPKSEQPTRKEIGPFTDPPAGTMTYRTDPKTGEKVSLLGFGCMRFPTMSGEDGQGRDDPLDQEEVNASIAEAIQYGVNYFDTSPRYCQGRSERVLAEALSPFPRDSYLLATKMSNQTNYSREESLAIYNRSHEDLRTDYFDFYLIHSVGMMEVYKKRYLDNGILDFLLAEREAGRIKRLGWSFHGQKEFFDYMIKDSGIDWDFVQIQLNYSDWYNVRGSSNASAEYLYETLAEREIPAVIMEPLFGGRLTRLNKLGNGILHAANPDATPASWAFRFVGSLPNVLTVLSGMTYRAHLRENLRTFSPLHPITEDEKSVLKQVADTIRNILCSCCLYCMPCPYGVDIPHLFLLYDRYLDENRFPDNPALAEYPQLRRAFLEELDEKFPLERQPQHCIGCRKCESECPQYIKVADELEKLDTFISRLRDEDRANRLTPPLPAPPKPVSAGILWGSISDKILGNMKVDGGLAELTPKTAPSRSVPLLPPGALKLPEFDSVCTGCGLCVSKCPNHLIRLSNDPSRPFRPELSYLAGYCRSGCRLCTLVCPAGAIRPLTVEEKEKTPIGTAVWNKDLCVVNTDKVRCTNCFRHCPVKAIELEPVPGQLNDDGTPAAVPSINTDLCIGCGACEHLCPARPLSAITVESGSKK